MINYLILRIDSEAKVLYSMLLHACNNISHLPAKLWFNLLKIYIPKITKFLCRISTIYIVSIGLNYYKYHILLTGELCQ